MPTEDQLMQQATDMMADLFRSITDYSWSDSKEAQAFINARRSLEEVIGSSEGTAPDGRAARFSAIVNGALGEMIQEVKDPTVDEQHSQGLGHGAR